MLLEIHNFSRNLQTHLSRVCNFWQVSATTILKNGYCHSTCFPLQTFLRAWKCYLPMLTILIPSSSSRNLKHIVTFSSFCVRKFGLLLYLWNFLPERTSIKPSSLSPSPKSNSRSAIFLLTVFKCSLAHLVNVILLD